MFGLLQLLHSLDSVIVNQMPATITLTMFLHKNIINESKETIYYYPRQLVTFEMFRNCYA